MKQSTKDQLEGKFHEAKGAAKEAIGHAANKPDTETKGQNEKLAGKAQKKVGEAEKVFGK